MNTQRPPIPPYGRYDDHNDQEGQQEHDACKVKIGDKVKVMDKGLLMLQQFAPPNAKPNNEGIVISEMDEDTWEIQFPIGNDDPKNHSQVAPYPKNICTKI